MKRNVSGEGKSSMGLYLFHKAAIGGLGIFLGHVSWLAAVVYVSTTSLPLACLLESPMEYRSVFE